MSKKTSKVASQQNPWETVRERTKGKLTHESASSCDSLEAFTTFTYGGYVVEPAHALIAATLDKVVAGEIRRLMIFAPPQHGKSELASVRLPAYWLGRRPDDPIILVSYAASLAESKSRQTRQIVESSEFGVLFPGIQTQPDSRAIDHWHLNGRRGGMLAAGVGGAITGHGAVLGIIDDPLENWQESQSATVRETAWEWYRTTFRTRVWEHGAIVLIMTRWHEEDLAGRLLAEQASEWTVLRLPALAETQAERDEANRLLGLPQDQPDPLGRQPGEPLCPRRFSLEALQSLKRDVGSLGWGSQYQGVPRAPEGNLFKRGWFPVVESAPYEARRIRYWDKSATAGGGDFTVGLLLAWSSGVYFIEDMVRGQWSSGERDAIIKKTADADARRYRHGVGIWMEQEPGSSGKDSAAAATRLLAGHYIRHDRPTGSKEVRAQPFASQAEGGNVRLVRASWNTAYLDELTSFPNGAHDDAVDASSGAFAKLANIRSAGSLRTYSGPRCKGRRSGLHVVICTRDELADLVIDDHFCLLVAITDPLANQQLPGHGLSKLNATLSLSFANLDPADCQDRWDDLDPHYCLRPSELIMNRDHAKRFWSHVLRQWADPLEVIVLVDEGDGRALSVALALRHVMPHWSVMKFSDPDWIPKAEDAPPNRHIFETTKLGRATIAC